MQNTVYDQFYKAFSKVSAYILMKGDKAIGKVVIKYPQDGAGRLNLFFHIQGLPMVKGTAGGYGYDKINAAFQDAAEKATKVKLEKWQTSTRADEFALANDIYQVVSENGGLDWRDSLRKIDIIILHAV